MKTDRERAREIAMFFLDNGSQQSFLLAQQFLSLEAELRSCRSAVEEARERMINVQEKLRMSTHNAGWCIDEINIWLAKHPSENGGRG